MSRTKNLQVSRSYNPDTESQLKALEILLREPPREDREGRHQATLDTELAGAVQGRKEAQ